MGQRSPCPLGNAGVQNLLRFAPTGKRSLTKPEYQIAWASVRSLAAGLRFNNGARRFGERDSVLPVVLGAIGRKRETIVGQFGPTQASDFRGTLAGESEQLDDGPEVIIPYCI